MTLSTSYVSLPNLTLYSDDFFIIYVVPSEQYISLKKIEKSMSKKRMNILVTGATGFVGKRVSQYLAQSHHTIMATGRNAHKAKDLTHPHLTWKFGSLNDESFCDEITQNIDLIIHAAGKVGTWGDYESYHLANVDATEKLINMAKKNKVSRFINISSPSIYFNFKDQYNVKEDFLPKKFSHHYAHTKYLAEEIVKKSHSSIMGTVSLRPRLIIGAGDTNVLPRLIEMYKKNKLFIIGKGNNQISVTSIGNLLSAIDLCLKAPHHQLGQAFNIGDKEPIPYKDLLSQLMKNLHFTQKIKNIPYVLAYMLAKSIELISKMTRSKSEPVLLPISVGIISRSMTLDISKAKSLLGYHPVFTTQDGLKEFADWWKSKEKSHEIT